MLVYSSKFLSDIGNHPTPFMQELDGLARQGALPVTLEVTDRGWRMAVYAARYVAWLYPTKGGDAYSLGHAARRQFRDEDRLVKRALLMRCPGGFRAYPDLRTVNVERRAQRLPATSTFGDHLWREWRSLESAATQPPAQPSAHGRYFDMLDMVVDASRQIEADRYAAMPPYHYASRGPAKEQRYSARGVYRFRMAGREAPVANTMVCLGDWPQVRGKVIRVEGREVTVRFEPGADYERIRGQGVLRPLPSDRVFRAQREAISQLRRRETGNPRLIDTLVSASFLPYQPAVGVRPELDLDPDQRDAFQRALEVPDVLSVLGPPGAGKTTTIIEVVKASVARGQRVLVTSHTHRAVDNVLESLPPDLNVVRIGSEDNMSTKVKALSSESRVEAVRKEILGETALFDALSQVREQRPALDRYLAHLRSLLDQTGAAQTELDRLAPAISQAVEQASGPLRPQLAKAEQAVAQHRSVAEAHDTSLRRVERQVRKAHEKINTGSPVAFAWRWFLNWRRGRADRLHQALAEARAALGQAESTLAVLRGEAERIAAHDPHVARLTTDREHTQKVLAGLWLETTQAGEFVLAMLRTVAATPPLPGPTVPQWLDFHQWCESTLAMVDRRVTVLGQWRERISDLSVELEREIASYAQVVGATCIGTDTSALISKLEFDLAIVDEAGQISTPNLLVPLVRSRRAMLVGDHKQLPPFLDEEVRQWADSLDESTVLTQEEAGKVGAFLAKSGFELLFPNAPASNAVWLKTQRRIPVEIATFVSNSFYFRQLRTEHPGSVQDVVFRSPFAMVDTSDRAPARRAETAMRGRGEAIRHGYRSELEAGIIADLVAGLSAQYRDWAVIVPFNAQKELVVQRLTAAIGASTQVADNVGSVDSFQGGERDLIIFGFTRSNPRGDIGFLRELRRFNVAITRAKRQLVLVGDLSTLLIAKDQEFRELMTAMNHHLTHTGDRRSSLDVAAALKSLQERS
ncbi:DEAD/DEAH box helicase [Phytohabitans suffuscus]|uniref:DEAD/DEAH box helicase n=1 Tax=Phytohabitans suffuscus TaxID=624315 RepID=UPI001564EACC|nr:AAA domain-containing protein [Phytohabitans suffuscus]